MPSSPTSETVIAARRRTVAHTTPDQSHPGPLPEVRLQLHRLADALSGTLLLCMVVFGPWAFGTTPNWTIQVMNWSGYALGVLLLGKWFLRALGGLPAHVGVALEPGPGLGRRLERLLGFVTVLILAYTFLGAWNARALYEPETWSFRYRDAIRWLPHSYDAASSWRMFGMYLGLAGLFWGARDWLRQPWRTPGEHAGQGDSLAAPGRSSRLRLLLWVLSVNGALVALQGIIQRVEGSEKLLWLVAPRVNQDPVSFFGPFAYRANASQYLNLIWPVTLGFWWGCQQLALRRQQQGHGSSRRHHLLISCVALMAVGPIVSTSRGGALVTAGLVVVAVGAIGLLRWRSTAGSKLVVLVLLGVSVGMALLLGWQDLGPRFEGIQESYWQRESIYMTGRRMADEHAVFGTGAGTLSSLFQLYRRSEVEYWPAQLHNDWLETLVTFGWVGTGLLLLALLLAATRWLVPGGLPAPPLFGFLVCGALAGCLIHARFDFPLQIHSILALFLVLCATLSCLGRADISSGHSELRGRNG